MIRDLRIEPILNGFIVQAGCQRLAYTSVDELITDIGSYLREPEATEKRILKDKGFNRKHTMEMRMPEPGPTQEANSLANYAATPNQLTELPQRAN